MKRFQSFFIAAVIVLGATPASARDPAAEAEIRKIEHAIADARTVDNIVHYYDPNIVFYDFVPPTVRGREAFKKHVQAVFATMTSFDVKVLEMDVDADGNLAFANSLQRVIVKNAAGETTLDGVFRNTNCYHKVDGQWLITYGHVSFPVDLDAGTIVLDNGASANRGTPARH
jgi:ketosteroid isomerase-like protein